MTRKELTIDYIEYASIEELNAEDRLVVEAAIDAMKGSYAPYSNFNVGAAVLLEDGSIVKGANQENAAYPSGLCAERTALFAAGANHPDNAPISLAIVASQNGVICPHPASPCGACRQVMAQCQTRYGRDLKVILAGSECLIKFEKVDDLLPFIFDNI